MLANTHWMPDTQFMCIPKGVPEDKIAVLLALMSYMLKPEQQAATYDKGYFYPGPAVKGVTLAMAPQESRTCSRNIGRPVYDDLIAKLPTAVAADAGASGRGLPALGPGNRRRHMSAASSHALRRHRARPSPHLPSWSVACSKPARPASATIRPRATSACSTGFRERFPDLAGRRSPTGCSTIPSIDVIVCAAHPVASAPAIADRGDAPRQGRHGRQAGRHHASRSSPRSRRAVARDRAASSRSASPSASSCPRPIVAGKLIADGAIGRVVQTHRAGPAPAQPRDPAGLVLRHAPLWRHPRPISPRTRSTSSCISPARTMPRSSPARHRPFRRCPTCRTSRISARSCCAATGPAAISGSTGSPPTACRPGATAG